MRKFFQGIKKVYLFVFDKYYLVETRVVCARFVMHEKDWVNLTMEDREKLILVKKATKKDVFSHIHLSNCNLYRYL